VTSVTCLLRLCFGLHSSLNTMYFHHNTCRGTICHTKQWAFGGSGMVRLLLDLCLQGYATGSRATCLMPIRREGGPQPPAKRSAQPAVPAALCCNLTPTAPSHRAGGDPSSYLIPQSSDSPPHTAVHSLKTWGPPILSRWPFCSLSWAA